MGRFKIWSNLMLAAIFLAAVGCDSGVSDDDDTLDSAKTDAAESIAVLQGEESGGLMEEVMSVFESAQTGAVDGSGKTSDFFFSREYNDETGTWTVTRLIELGSLEEERYLYHKRVFEIQFRDSLGSPQIFYNTQGELAEEIELTIVEGEGAFVTPHIKAERVSVSGNFVATNADEEIVTVNGTYAHSGVHTLENAFGSRELDFEMSANIIDLMGPRDNRRDLSEAVSGTVEGDYFATLTVERGDVVEQTEIDVEFTIVIEEGEASITIEGDTYASDVRSGELLPASR